MRLELNREKVLEHLLKEEFLSGYKLPYLFMTTTKEDFYKWCFERDFISKEHYDLQVAEIKETGNNKL